MSIKEDAAVKLNEAYEAALITPHPVCRHGEFIDYVIDNTHLTFKYILLQQFWLKPPIHQLIHSAFKRNRNCQARMMQEPCAIRS